MTLEQAIAYALDDASRRLPTPLAAPGALLR
jgi:hypothetical protein